MLAKRSRIWVVPVLLMSDMAALFREVQYRLPSGSHMPASDCVALACQSELTSAALDPKRGFVRSATSGPRVTNGLPAGAAACFTVTRVRTIVAMSGSAAVLNERKPYHCRSALLSPTRRTGLVLFTLPPMLSTVDDSSTCPSLAA